METCNNEIQISFSPPELEVVRRAVAKFIHVERSGTRYLNQLDHAKNVIRMFNKKMPVCAAYKRRSSIIPMKAPIERLDGCYVVSRSELEEIM